MPTRYAALPVQYDIQRMAEDMALKGWTRQDLAAHAGVSGMTVTNFFSGKSVRPPTVKKLASALGYTVKRYLISAA
jgi:transcriptional regulator with XRE-family HTH domain